MCENLPSRDLVIPQTVTTRLIRWAMLQVRTVISFIGNCARHLRLTGGYSRHFRTICNFVKKPIGGTKGHKYETSIPEKWLLAHENIKRRVIKDDTEDWQKMRLIYQGGNLTNENELKFVAGVDISYVKEGKTACAALVVCQMPDLRVVYEHFEVEEITVPYIAGFLTFREVMPILGIYRKLLIETPQFKPQVILVDGNGILHPRGAGLACHLGVLADIPCVGVAKNLLKIDGLHEIKKRDLDSDAEPLITKEGFTIGMAVTTGNAHKPVFVSIGHKISIETAVWLVKLCSKYRVPEPIRQADIRSRKYLERHPHLKKASRPSEV